MSLLGTTNAFGKDVWLPGATKQYEGALGKTFEIIDAAPDWRVEGRNIFGKITVGDSLGQGVTPEGGDFPEAKDPSYDEFKLAMSRLSHTIQLTFDEWEMVNSNDAAAVPVVQEKISQGVDKILRDTIRQMYGDGSAKLARCAATSASTTVNLQSSNGDSGSANQYDRDRFNWLAPNRAYIDIVDATTGNPITNGSGRKVVNTSESGNTITLDSAGGNVTTTTSHVIVWHDSVAGGGTYASREFAGILAAIDDDNTYLNIDRMASGKSMWKSTVITGATAGTNELPSLDRILKLVNTMAKNSSDGKQPGPQTHVACSNYGVQASILSYVAPGMRFTPAMGAFDVAPAQGFQDGAIPLLNMPYWTDVHAPHNNLFLFDKTPDNSFRFVRAKRALWGMLDFMPGTIQGIWLPKPGASAGRWAAAAVAILTGLVGLMTAKPNAHGRLDDITELGV
jgi:hypothetical protein